MVKAAEAGGDWLFQRKNFASRINNDSKIRRPDAMSRRYLRMLPQNMSLAVNISGRK
jgi:hypothetical protein